jgi:fructose-1,6-bisphosphatase I
MLLEDRIKQLDPDLGRVFGTIAECAAVLSRQLPFRVGLAETLNPFGERQAKLDVYANDLFTRSLVSSGVVGEVASEELEKPIRPPSARREALAISMDPLDGSSNITTNNPLGSIFGVWRGTLPQKGRNQIASAFVTYGPTLTLTLTAEREVEQYVEVRDGKNLAKFVLAYKSMKLPENPQVYGFGGLRSTWVPPVERFVEKLESRAMKLRYGGTLIGDYNQVLQRGGIFSYPALKDKPEGKLRILYETAPISLITELAGGYSSNGRESILEIEPKSLTQTSAFYTGNKELVMELETDISGSHP